MREIIEMSAIERDLISLRFSASSPGVAFGDPPLAPKAMGLCLFRTVQSRCLRLARQAPSLSWESRASEEGSEGARLKSADVGVGKLEQAPTEVVSTLGEDGAAALKVLAHRLRSEDSPARNPRSPKLTL